MSKNLNSHRARGPRPLRVLINALPLRLGGGGSYIVNQTAALGKVPGLDITVLAAGGVVEQLRASCDPSVRVHDIREQGTFRRFLFEQCVLPFRVRKYDVVYQAASFAMFASCRPQVVTNQNPHYFGASAREFWNGQCPRRIAIERIVARASVRRADAFVTVSHAFRATVEEEFGQRDNVHVLRNATPRFPSAFTTPTDTATETPYVLTVAHDYPHKDWDGLIRVFCDSQDLPRLVIAGEFRNQERQAALMRFAASDRGRGRVELLGPIGDRKYIAELYRGAACFVAHSFLEAGPMTPLEAMAHGVRLAASDIPTHREACGEYAAYYGPRDPDELARAIREALAEGRPSAPTAQVGSWTWTDNAAQLASLLGSVAGARSNGRS